MEKGLKQGVQARAPNRRPFENLGLVTLTLVYTWSLSQEARASHTSHEDSKPHQPFATAFQNSLPNAQPLFPIPIVAVI